MGRRKRAGFGDVVTTRAAFARLEARCPSCRRPIGPEDAPTAVRSLDGAPSRLATMRCRRCDAMLTVRFNDEEDVAASKPSVP